MTTYNNLVKATCSGLIIFAKYTRCLISTLLLIITPCSWANEVKREIEFVIHAPQAKTIEILSDFNQWQNGVAPLVGPDKKGNWKIKLKLPISLNRIEYFYLIDGARRQVDTIHPVISDEFSGQNNVISIP